MMFGKRMTPMIRASGVSANTKPMKKNVNLKGNLRQTVKSCQGSNK